MFVIIYPTNDLYLEYIKNFPSNKYNPNYPIKIWANHVYGLVEST
jgi:hypothetical protein